MIEVIIPEDCFILLNCGPVHCGTPSWLINRGEYGKTHKSFFLLLLKKDFFLLMKSLFRKKIAL